MGLEGILEHVSPSQLGTFLRCGEQHRRRYFENEKIPPGISARSGSAAHKVAEVHDTMRIEGREGLLVDEAKDCARDEFKRLVTEEGIYLTPDEIPEANKLLNEGLNNALQASGCFISKVAPTFEPIAAEKVYYLEVDVLDVPIKCILDKVAISVLDGVQYIRDLKVQGKKKSQDWADGEIQPSFYQKAYEYHHGVWLPFEYDLIIPAKRGEPQYVPMATERDLRDWERILNMLMIFRKCVESGSFHPADPGSWACSPKYCGYYQTCKYARGWKMFSAPAQVQAA